MKLKQIQLIAVAAFITILSGCASSGRSTGNTTTSNTGISPVSVRIASVDTATADTVATASGDTVSMAGNANTITGSSEAERPARRDPNTIEVDGDASQNLSNYLRRVAGVFVLGEGPKARVSVRTKSSNTMMLPQERSHPLFIVDGMRWGHSYELVYNEIQLEEVKSIRVLKGVEAAMYGSSGANGVILIDLYGPGESRD